MSEYGGIDFHCTIDNVDRVLVEVLSRPEVLDNINTKSWSP